ncbi:MAG: SDR family oxidoreductase [bacterium]
MDLGLSGKVAMVAGASKGLGFAVARTLAMEGAIVSMVSRDADAIASARDKILRETTASILALPVDVRFPQAIEEWREKTLKEFGRIDMLFANSGGPPAGGFLAFDDPAWQNAVDLLLLSSVRMARAVIPAMKQQGGGSIVFSTSSSVKEPIENLTLSNVVRAAIPALAKTLAREFASSNIRVNNLIPGRIDTDRVRELDTINAQKKGITAEEQKKVMSAAIPMGRYGEADEFARAVVFIMSPAASYITGATLQVDGGVAKSVM